MSYLPINTAWPYYMPYSAYAPVWNQQPYMQPQYPPFAPTTGYVLPTAFVAMQNAPVRPSFQLSEMNTLKQHSASLELPKVVQNSVTQNSAKSVDLFRDTPLRYGGYLNEAGEAFNSIISKTAVRWSYHLTAVYVALDTIEKAIKGFTNKQGTRGDKAKNAGKEAIDAAIFQYFASYLVPAKIIEVGKKFMDKSVARTMLSPALKKWGPTAISLAAIPLIVKPIDHSTHWSMNHFIRPWLGTPQHH